jgi:hypothetical protein
MWIWLTEAEEETRKLNQLVGCEIIALQNNEKKTNVNASKSVLRANMSNSVLESFSVVSGDMHRKSFRWCHHHDEQIA